MLLSNKKPTYLGSFDSNVWSFCQVKTQFWPGVYPNAPMCLSQLGSTFISSCQEELEKNWVL